MWLKTTLIGYLVQVKTKLELLFTTIKIHGFFFCRGKCNLSNLNLKNCLFLIFLLCLFKSCLIFLCIILKYTSEKKIFMFSSLLKLFPNFDHQF